MRDRNYSHQLVSWHGVAAARFRKWEQVVVDIAGIRTIRKVAGTAQHRIQLYVSWGFQ